MAINLSFMATEAPVVVYLADGSSKSFPPQEEEHLQLPSGAFCTISSTAGNEDTGEHPPTAAEFAEAMIAFWASIRDKALDAAGPTATPL